MLEEAPVPGADDTDGLSEVRPGAEGALGNRQAAGPFRIEPFAVDGIDVQPIDDDGLGVQARRSRTHQDMTSLCDRHEAYLPWVTDVRRGSTTSRRPSPTTL